MGKWSTKPVDGKWIVLDPDGNVTASTYAGQKAVRLVERLNAADEMRTLLGRSLRLIEVFPFPSESDKQLIRAIQDCFHAALTPTSERT